MKDIMDYTGKHSELKKLFNEVDRQILIPGSDIRIINVPFVSGSMPDEFINKNDISIKENLTFTYPVFMPSAPETGRPILLLHGLNERSWTKYLAWAYFLAERARRPVILFPISFHINRSPGSWKDPRIMNDMLQSRDTGSEDIRMSTFANFALSTRLSDDPMRFFNSGLQSVTDIVKLVNCINQGDHPVVGKCNSIDIFSYSIGAFLSQIIIMANPDSLFNGTRLFIFCGGSVFSNMKGTSKLIMDSRAFERIYSFYLRDFEKFTEGKTPLSEFLRNNRLGQVFRSMIDLDRIRNFRENLILRLKDQILAITLKNDRIIPSEGVLSTLSKWNARLRSNVQVWDFPYDYSHENPFPVDNTQKGSAVNDSFSKLLNTAMSFLL
jgi:pimeloyl-ACP methyl ester carboxylesterase